MKLWILILTILFSYSVLADCCNTPEFEESCQVETLKENQCSDDKHDSKDHDICHCSFSCSSKIVKQPDTISANLNFYTSIAFYHYNQSLSGINPSPGFRPPIA